MIRGACVSNDHPDSLLFVQVYRLLSFYSLVKPPKGSNVQGAEIFETLLQSKDVACESDDNKSILASTLQKMIEKEDNEPKE